MKYVNNHCSTVCRCPSPASLNTSNFFIKKKQSFFQASRVNHLGQDYIIITNIQRPRAYTGELIGIDYLFEQTGKALDEVDVEQFVGGKDIQGLGWGNDIQDNGIYINQLQKHAALH